MEKTVVKKKLSVPKKISIWLAAILATLMAVVCLWWAFIYFFGPTRYLESTYNWDYITTTAGDKQQILRVNYLSNKNANGLEMFEMDWTYFQDETKNKTYSQGLQYVATATDQNIDFQFAIDADKKLTANSEENYFQFPFGYAVYEGWGGYKVNSETTEYYNYESSDNYQTTTGSTNPLDVDSKLKIELGQDPENTYLMVPKGLYTAKESSEKTEFLPNSLFSIRENRYYCYYDYNFLAKIVYESVKGMAGGTQGYIEFEFGDYFDYYKFDVAKNSYGERLTQAELADDKVLQSIKSYCVAYVQVSDDGAKSYNDSMFKMVKNSATFNLSPDRVTDDFFTGRTIINVDLYAFDYIKVYENYIALKLKDSFIEEYLPLKDDIALQVEIDIDKIEELGFEYFGLAKDSGLNNFTIKSIHTVKDMVKSEVTL